MTDRYIEFLPGFFQGITRVCISYPFDYLRLHLQTNKEKTIISSFKNNYKKIYRGLFFPLATVPIDRAVTFYMYEKLNEKNINPIWTSLVPSIVSNIYMTPINLLNSNYIYHNKSDLKNLFKKNLNKKIYSGFNIEIIRNTFSSFLFLYSYNIYSKYSDSPFLNGSLSSLTMWTILYPLDTIKAKKFIYKKAYYDIIKTTSIKNFYKGISLIYLRAFPSAGLGMYVYEYIKKKI